MEFLAYQQALVGRVSSDEQLVVVLQNGNTKC